MNGSGATIKLGAGLIALGAATVWLGVLPELRTARLIEAKVESARNSIDRSQTRAQDIKVLADTLGEARVFAASRTKELVQGDISLLMHDIGGFLTTLNVSSHEMKQDRSEERNGVLVTPVTLTMSAGFSDLRQLLTHIEQGERLVRIARVQIGLPRGAQPGSSPLQIEVQFESISPLTPRPTLANASEEGRP
jgi:hypothetical protein